MINSIEIVKQRLLEYDTAKAIYWKRKYFSYREFYEMIQNWNKKFKKLNIPGGSVCAVLGDYSPLVISLFFALMENKCILVPFTRAVKNEIPEFSQIAGVEYMFIFDEEDNFILETYNRTEKKALIKKQQENKRSGLVVFSSGSTGKPKGILQDCEKVMNKFIQKRQGWKTILFLMMDHFGGFNTLLAALAYGGMAICIRNRTPEEVCLAIEDTKADLLPTTPTFLNLLIASACYKKYDIESIKLITYGTEMINETTLLRLKDVFQNAQFKQTYGLSELGVLRSKSESNHSVWLKIGGNEFETKVVDNILWIKAESNMVGYLNAPNPFDAEGWFCTGDQVEIKGDYIRFLGRKTEIINVGGQKVFPAEIEAVILEDPNVDEVAVLGKRHPLMGEIVMARVSLSSPEHLKDLSIRLRKLCSGKLAKYKIPVKFEIIGEDDQYNARFKKIRL